MRKRILSCILVLCLVFSLLPLSAFADNTKASNESTVDIGGTTSVGKMISNEISAQNAESAQEESNISDLVVEGNTATVTFMTNAPECDIVVGIYDENDTTRMLASGTASVFSGDGKVSIELSGDIPANFIATAYMLESVSHSPLCKAYTTQLYTSEMQAFLATTVSDYDEDLVLNLDESEETNFAVFNTDTLRADESSGMSVEDRGNGTYVVNNADAGVKSLTKGDEFAFTYDDGTVLLISVSSVDVKGNTVTITEATDADLQDFFDYVKIEGTNDSNSEASIDTSDMDESVSLPDEQPSVQSRARAKSTNEEGTYESSIAVNLEHEDIKGSLKLGYEVKLQIYIKNSYKFVMLKADFTQSLSATFAAFKGEKSLNLPSVDVYIIAGVHAHLRPSLVVKSSASVKWTGKVKSTIGIAYDSDYGFVNKSSSPSCDSKLEMSGKIFLGLKVSLDITVVSDKIASAGLETKMGAELSEKKIVAQTSSGSKIHECNNCTEGSISFVMSLTGKVKFVNLEYERTFAEKKWKIADYYKSITFLDGGWGTCPHINYRVTATVLDQNGNAIPNVPVECMEHSVDDNVTNSEGVATFYLPNGEYTLSVKSGALSASKKITIHNNEKKLEINLSTDSQNPDDSQIISSGKCGDNLTWTLDKNGTLTISGTGEMSRFQDYRKRPWFDKIQNIKSLIIKDGVTSISDIAFSDCENLTSASISDSVTSIGDRAFLNCYKLENISIPNGMTSIGEEVFWFCFSLSSVVIPDSVTSIGNSAFNNCTNLTSITIPDSVTSIGISAFSSCRSLTSVTIPDSVTSIDDSAFSGCDSLISVSIPDSVISIGEGVFSFCTKLSAINVDKNNTDYCSVDGVLFNKNKTELVSYAVGKAEENYTIPNSVTSIRGSTFAGADNLINITIPDNITSMGWGAFYGCDKLKSVTIGNGITSITDFAFSSCRSLTSITIPDSVTSIKKGVFDYCNALTDLYFVGSETQWKNINIDWDDNYRLSHATVHFNSNGSESPTTLASPDSNSAVGTNTALVENQRLTTAAELPVNEAVVKTTSFTDLMSEVEYVFIVVRDSEEEDYLASNNLCYIAQKQSDSSGSVSFAYYSAEGNVSESIYALHTHSYTDGVCVICGIVDPNYEPPHDHSFGEWVQTKAPTCTEKGADSRSCANCDAIETREVPALNHDIIHHDGKAATCTEKGWKAYDTCSRCDYTTYEEIAATGHHYAASVTAPTCAEKGYTTHTCICGKTYVDSYVPALNHNIIHHDGKAATCTEKGWKAYDTCSRCDYTTYEEIAATGHHHAAIVTAPTCTEKGYTTHTCTCGDSYVDSYTNALGHSYENGSCTRCGAADPNYIAVPTLSITTSSGKPKISWNAVDGAVKYWVYRSTDGKSFKYYDKTTKTSYTNSSTTIGTTYYYKVKAVKTVNGKDIASDYSATKSIKCAPAAPTVSISRVNGKPKLSWKAVTGATKYWIYRSTDGKNFKYYDMTTKTSYTNSGAASGTKYYYKVKAVKVVNGNNVASAYSSTKNLLTTLATPSVSITTSNGKPKVTWSAVKGADKYYVYRSTDGKNFKYYDTTTKTGYTNTGAKKNTKYYYKIKAVCASNSYANSAQSKTVSIKATK